MMQVSIQSLYIFKLFIQNFSGSFSCSSSIIIVVVVVVVVVPVGQTIGSISSQTLAYDCLCTLELMAADNVA